MGSIPDFLLKLQYPAAKVLVDFFRLIPYRIAIPLARSLGLIAWLADPFHRKVARMQMRNALGPAYRPELVRNVFMNHGDIMVDAVRYAYMDDAEIRSRIIIEGKEHLDKALATRKGIMIITGHIGNWEILSHLPRLLDIQFCVMADVRKDPRLESLVDNIRVRSGATILPPKGKALMLIRELKRGNTIGMIMDQRGKRSDKLFCDFFGMPAPTNPAPAFIAIKGDAVILPVAAIKKDSRYTVRFFEPRHAASFGDAKEGIAPLAQYMQSWVESLVRLNPDQWFWLHCRWARRSEMRRIIRKGMDFRSFVFSEADKSMKTP